MPDTEDRVDHFEALFEACKRERDYYFEMARDEGRRADDLERDCDHADERLAESERVRRQLAEALRWMDEAAGLPDWAKNVLLQSDALDQETAE